MIHPRVLRALEEVLLDLDVPISRYEEAKREYDGVGEWLHAPDSCLAPYDPYIFPQGSFALGTAIRPIRGGDHDVDAVCCLRLGYEALSQQQLKELVGARLREHKRYGKILLPPEGGRRCWTLVFADEHFHFDILPAIPDDSTPFIAQGVLKELAESALRITDRETWPDGRWPRSNPRGYALWFRSRMQVALQKSAAARNWLGTGASLAEMPTFRAQTALQRIVQLLKRHRDATCGDDEDRPISIIITTLAAQAYDNQLDLVEAIFDVVPKLRLFIEQRGDRFWVPNPVAPAENFADKWHESPRKADAFFRWLGEVEEWFEQLRRAESGEALVALAKRMKTPAPRPPLAAAAAVTSSAARMQVVRPRPVHGSDWD